jgi:hypothetical protein
MAATVKTGLSERRHAGLGAEHGLVMDAFEQIYFKG